MCKACRANIDNTEPKTIATRNELILKPPTLPQSETSDQSEQALAELLLHGESQLICVVCNENMVTEDRCETCSCPCHGGCLHVDSSGNVTDICQNCATSGEQEKVSVTTDVTPHDVVTGHVEEKSPLSNQSRTSSDQSLECSQQKSSSETDIDRLDPIMDSVAQCQDTKMVVEPKAGSRPNKKAQSQTDATVKLPEI